MRLSSEGAIKEALTWVLAGAVGLAALSACEPGNDSEGSGDGRSSETGRSCDLVMTAAGDGYDITASYTGTFPDGTVLTGHVNYRASASDSWERWTPPDFTVPIDGTAHYAKAVTHEGKNMELVSAKGTLDPTPDGHAVRTTCGSVTIE